MAEPAAEAPKEAPPSRLKGRAPFLIAGALLIVKIGRASC